MERSTSAHVSTQLYIQGRALLEVSRKIVFDLGGGLSSSIACPKQFQFHYLHTSESSLVKCQ